MTQKKPYKDFIDRYLARGAVGVSVGLAAIAPTAAVAGAKTSVSEQELVKPFSDRLSMVRSVVSMNVNEPVVVSQVVVRPPPPPPFRNFFGKAPFQDAFRNVPRPAPKAAEAAPAPAASAPAAAAPAAASKAASRKASKKGSRKRSKKVSKKGSQKASPKTPQQ